MKCIWLLFLANIYLCDLFAKMHHDFSTVIVEIGWLHIDSEVAPKDIDKNNSSTSQVET